MKKHLLILIVISLCIPFLRLLSDDQSSDEKAAAFFRRLIESAHPLPAQKPGKFSDLPLAKPVTSSIFLNVNTIEPETEAYQMQNESSIAVNPKNPKNMIASAVDYRDSSSTWVYVSSDGGHHWKNINLRKPFKGWRSTNDPSVAFDSDGNGYLVYGGFGNLNTTDSQMVGENGVFMAKTTDQGKTWQAHIPVILHTGKQTLDSNFEDKYYITIDNSPASPYFNTLYIPWKRVTPKDSSTRIVIARSSDRGTTWSVPVNVSARLTGSSEDTTFGQSFPICATGPDGTVYVVWHNGIAHSIGFAKSDDGGKTFTAPRSVQKYASFAEVKKLPEGWRHAVKERVRAESYPVIVVDNTSGPCKGNVYLAWSADSPPNVYFTKSTDKGATWSKPVIVHSDTTGDQFWEWMSIDPLNGDIGIMYFDSRNDPANMMVECYVSYSSDGGTTFIDRKAADFSSDLRLNPFSANSFAGDYSGCAFYGGHIYPTWIDMRNAESNIFDSDVFTAIVNVNASAPPENFEAKTNPLEPKQIDLGWDLPPKRAFGQPMVPGTFNFLLYRSDSLVAVLPGETDNYTDKGLEPYKFYEYKIRTVVAADTGMYSKSSAWSGGSAQPAAPVISSSLGCGDNTVSLSFRLPCLRSDNVTPLVNLNKLKIIRDSSIVAELDLAASDTGKTIKYTDTVPVKGFYNYSAVVADKWQNNTIQVGESVQSNSVLVYSGEILPSLKEDFNVKKLPKYYMRGKWVVYTNFFKSAPSCLVENKENLYPNSARDTLILFPVTDGTNDSLYLDFWQAAIVHHSDTAFIEMSVDNLRSWSQLAYYNMDMYQPWSDEYLRPDDFRHESLKIPAKPGDTVYIRYRFWSSGFRNDRGWFIDDISLAGEISSVDEKGYDVLISVYPNPAADFINIYEGKAGLPDHRISIFNIFGEEMALHEAQSSAPNAHTLDISSLAPGYYIVKLEFREGRIFYRSFIKAG